MKKFNDNQLRSIQSTVHVVEEKLRDMEALTLFTLEHAQPAIQVSLDHDLTAAEMAHFKNKVAEIKQVLGKITETYGLKKETTSLRKLINTKANFIWEDITGSNFDHLRGYGELNENLRGEYEGHFKKLEHLVDELIQK